jgi:hypothetical protein
MLHVLYKEHNSIEKNRNLPLILYSKELEKSSYIITGKRQSIEAITLIYKLKAITARSDTGTSMPKRLIIQAAITLLNSVKALCDNAKHNTAFSIPTTY